MSMCEIMSVWVTTIYLESCIYSNNFNYMNTDISAHLGK